MSNKYYYLQICTDQIAAMEAAGLGDLAAKLRADIVEIDSEEASACRESARDNEDHTPEWSGPVSFCEDGKAWVMTWELVDDPNAPEDDDDDSDYDEDGNLRAGVDNHA